jgi:putative sigma-54 modulation protein
VHVNHHLVKGIAAAAEHPLALDKALDKVEHQMRKLHERRVSSRNGARARGGRPGEETTLAAEDAAGPAAGREAPIVVKTKQFEVKPMTVEEAALQMELLDHDFFVFRNTDNERAAVIYKRRDGALGLIEVSG